jgi:hypothetical protein
MNPCAKNKRSIAWMAAGVLDVTDAEVLRQHLNSCPPCQRYWQSMCELSERLVNASDLPQAAPTESFHRSVVLKITAQGQRTSLFNWVTVIQRFWQERPLATLSTGVVLTFATLLWIRSFSHQTHHGPSPVQIVVTAETPARATSPPTLASYRRAADTSLENLDALLTQEAARTSSASETFTVSSLLTSSLEN